MAKSQSAEPVKRQPAPGRARGGRRAPLLLETAYAITFGLTLVAGLATAALSALAGAPAWLIAVRAGLAVLVLGLVFWLVNYQLMHGAFEAAVEELRARAPQPADQPAASTQEWKA